MQANNSIKKHVRNSIILYLTDESYCASEWIKNRIIGSWINEEDLKKVFCDLLEDYGNNPLYRKLFKICQKAGFKSSFINIK